MPSTGSTATRRPAGKVRFATYPTSWLYLRQTGRLPAGILPTEPGVWAWYVVQNRPGAFSPLDRALVARGHPAYVVQKWGVPLIWVFPFHEIEQEGLTTKGQRSETTTAGSN